MNLFSLGRKLLLKAGEPHVRQRHEIIERKLEYYYIIIFPEWTIDFTSTKLSHK